MAGNLRSDSPICRRIVLAFLDFLKSVEPAPGVDLEGLDVVRECLEEGFKLSQSSIDDGIQPGLLIDLFTSREADEQVKFKSATSTVAMENTLCATSASQQSESSNDLVSSSNEDQVMDLLGPVPVTSSNVPGRDSEDELLGKFLAALDKINFFMLSPGGVDDPVQVAKATRFFTDAITELNYSQGHIVNLSSLAETLKSKGNQSMQLKLYCEAVELYTCAIALCEKNAVYYCNRAAAYTQLHQYTEAIEDCLKSIEIDPKYSKAYSRLGLAYYSQGNYIEALKQGFFKALELDPSNNSVKEIIQAAQQKLMEQYRSAEADQEANKRKRKKKLSLSVPFVTNQEKNTRPTPGQESDAQSGGPSSRRNPFASIPVHASIPADFVNVFRNMASASQGDQVHERAQPGGNAEGGPNEPGITVDANVSVNIGDAAPPEQMSDVLRLVMDMIAPQQSTQGGDMHRGSERT